MKQKMFLWMLCIFSCSFTAFAQQTVTGIVIDTSGEPLIGASVTVKGTTNGNVTDIAGKFSLTAAPDDVLVVSYLGYKTQEVIVGGGGTNS